jgi:hypothetical protein
MELTPARFRELARNGARLELERIFRAFPELRPHAAPPDDPPPEATRAERRRKRRRLTAKERRDISRRMRAYWDAKRTRRAA